MAETTEEAIKRHERWLFEQEEAFNRHRSWLKQLDDRVDRAEKRMERMERLFDRGLRRLGTLEEQLRRVGEMLERYLRRRAEMAESDAILDFGLWTVCTALLEAKIAGPKSERVCVAVGGGS
jgi:hypothetical protein